MKSSKIRNALITSLLCMFLCITMLVGTTFAWFTDTASTGVNKIQAGNLKVDLLMYNGTEYESINNSNFTDLFTFGATEAEKLWEPGKTKFAYLAVKNKGDLALKYNIILDIKDNGLADALQYAIVDEADNTTTFADWAAITADPAAQIGNMPKGAVTAAPNGRLSPQGTDYFLLAVHMDENAGNEYQGKTCEIGISVTATQAAEESDSFSAQYDAAATFEGGSGGIKTYEYGLTFTEAGEHTINSGVKATVDNAPAVTASGKDIVVTITGGEFTAAGLNAPVIRTDNDATVVISGGFFYASNGYDLLEEKGSGYILLKGGTFVNFDPSNVTVRYDCKVVEETKENGDTWYTVVKIPEGDIATEFVKTSEEMKDLSSGGSIGKLLRTDGYTYYFEFKKNQWNSSSEVYFYLKKANEDNADIKITKTNGTVDYIQIDMKGLKVEDGSFIDDVFVYDEEITAIEFPDNGKWTADYCQQESGGHWYLRQLAPKSQQD